MLAEEFGIITDNEVGEAMESPEILEDYPDDRPHPSCLVLGFTKADRPLHLVAAFDAAAGNIIVVTVYHPDATRWEDYRRRK